MNPKRPPIEVTCAKCGETFALPNWTIRRRRKRSISGEIFCSLKCSSQRQQKKERPPKRHRIKRDLRPFVKAAPPTKELIVEWEIILAKHGLAMWAGVDPHFIFYGWDENPRIKRMEDEK